jgi:hypothetical protein
VKMPRQFWISIFLLSVFAGAMIIKVALGDWEWNLIGGLQFK